MNRAREAGLDLVEVDSNGNPPVCRILDYGKFKYEQAKKEREGRKHQRATMVHEVRMRPRTGQHDIDLKVRTAERLLAEGDKVKLSVMFRGREMSHPEVGHDVLQRALQKLTDVAGVEKPPGMEGRFLSVILTPTAKKPVAAAKASEAPDGDSTGAEGDVGSDGGSPNGDQPESGPEGEQASAPVVPEDGVTPEPAATGSTNES
jgi:translation initiation factor IF-3